ncbi:MAG: hypothetical protein PHC88_05670 [Terrimicrobiaceae bacterium]|nr:hypothetical protein [Terrimicrobiaceae bacterium]
MERGYGAFGIVTGYKAWDSDEQEIKYRRFANPDAVLWDPDCKEADWSDMEDGFVLSRYSEANFKEAFPDAEVTSFGTDQCAIAPNWVNKEWGVQVGEYWRVEKKPREIFWIEDGTPKGKKVFRDDDVLKGAKISKDTVTLASGQTLRIKSRRKTHEPVLRQYLTNGIEILDRTEPPGTQVPIFPIIGKERFVKDGTTENGGQVQRVISSYITMAVDGQMLFDYYATNEAEEVGLTPKPKYAGYEGQFDTQTDWKNLNKVTASFVEFKPVVDAATNQVLALPRWDSYTPNIAALDIGKESARRAIQAAVGSYGFTKLDDTNVKSGKAINALEKKGDLASFHLIDSYKLSVQRASRYVNEILDEVESEPGERGIRKEDGTHELVKVGAPSVDKDGQPQDLRYSPTDDAQHGVTISTGPSYVSQREEATEFADVLLQSQIPGLERILALVIRLKNLGPIGDQIADRLELPEFKKDQQGKLDPVEVQKTIQQYEAALEDAMKQIQELKTGVPKIQADQQNTQAKIQSDREIALAKIDADKEIAANQLRVQVLAIESKEALALLGHQVAEIQAQLAELAAEGQQASAEQHALETQAAEHEHATASQQADHANAQEQQQADQQHQQEMQAGQQEHAAETQIADQAHQTNMQQTDIEAQPDPATTSD